MEKTVSKNRTPSRCREWERNRRNKFNDAVSRLGEIVKEINKALDGSCKDADNVQYPKVEIIEKAILCLKNFEEEKTQMKAEILALQVKIDSGLKNKIDASTQVFVGINKKSNGKYVKMMMLNKSKAISLKEKNNIHTNKEVKVPSTIKIAQKMPNQNLPTILPKTIVNDKKRPDNTIVVLPAAPYLFPQRPLILPTVPPAFVLVDNLQSLNKSTFPIITRNNGDVTKTTMVNILPISAYSRPHSATKSKKGAAKPKVDTSKKINKKTKLSFKVVKESNTNNDNSKAITNQTSIEEDKTKELSNPNPKSQDKSENVQVSEVKTVNEVSVEKEIKKPIVNDKCKEVSLENNKIKETVITKELSPSKCTELSNIEKESYSSFSEDVTTIKTTESVVTSRNAAIKSSSEKHTTSEDKNKENKLPNILDTSLCENPVDGGNARLELAEEFLATSPTAAFLMSFPLVSGNRADSPAEDTPNTLPTKDNEQTRSDSGPQTVSYFEKSNDNKVKPSDKIIPPAQTNTNKNRDQIKFNDNPINKNIINKSSLAVPTGTVASENPFLNLPMPSLLPTTCNLTDPSYGLDFDCNSISKSMSTQSASYASSNNIFYKSDPFSSVKSSIYSTSNISSSHDFNSFGLYPCAMEKYSSKNKSDYPNVEDNLVKIGSSRLTYDIDLGWSHKSFDFVSCTNSTATFNKDNILTTAAPQYSSSYNPFNPEFHVPLTPTTSKKDSTSKPAVSFADTLTSFYSQPTNLWPEDVPFYTNSNISKSLTSKPQNYLPLDQMQANIKSHTSKNMIETDNVMKIPSNSNIAASHQLPEKYPKKNPSKMHINWMTSEIRPMQNCHPSNSEMKESHKTTYSQLDHNTKKQDYNEPNNYFPINMHNFTTQSNQEELQVWLPTRTQGTTEISIEPPPINLPTLVGDLALGPHDKKKNLAESNRNVAQQDMQNCSNFFSVTQLMNRSTNNVAASRYQGPNLTEPSKSGQAKQSLTNDIQRKAATRLESILPQPYTINDLKTGNSYEGMGQFPIAKSKNSKPDKSSKNQKNNYSAEALIRGNNCSQKVQENANTKYISSSQKYGDFNVPQDSSIAQVSHFPPIIDYSDNSYTSQQFSGTTLYNSTTNTMSNSFYSNFVPGSGNLMSSNYATGPFSSDFIDYNQTTECNYTNHKYEELKIRNNPTMFQQEKVSSNYKSSRRESTGKHKLECSKKESSKKYQNKRAKLNTDLEEWNDSHLLWQNKTAVKRHSNFMSEELPFSNYVGNQMPTQYQPDFFNSHLIPNNVQTMSHNVDRSLSSFPVSRANFNVSTLFPEITMKVQ